MAERVINPLRQATDPVLLSFLAKRGIDKDFVEFYQDYASRIAGEERSPYAKFYRDLKSNKRFMVVSGLPMVDAAGFRSLPLWRPKALTFENDNNGFYALVNKQDIRLVCLSDQPDRITKANDQVDYHPQIFLGGIEQLPMLAMPRLLPVDPLNPNYAANTLEWDYGFCKRRVRLVEGRFHGYWVFVTPPPGIVRIKYNQVGKLKVKLSNFAINDDEEMVTPTQIAEQARVYGYPVFIWDTLTVNPDADPETTSVDGRAYYDDNASLSWAAVHDEPGTGARAGASDSATIANATCDKANIPASFRVMRGFTLYDTSPLGPSADITDVVESLYGQSKQDNQSDSIGIVQSAPASNMAIVATDYDGFTVHQDTATAMMTIAAFITTGYNDFTFDATGRGWVNKTGITKTGVRLLLDYGETTAHANPPGTAVNSVQFYCAEQGAGFKPKLVVEYTVPASGGTTDHITHKMMGAGAI